MTPKEVATADQSRDALLEDQARELRLARQDKQGFASHEQFRAPTGHTVDRGGPGIEV